MGARRPIGGSRDGVEWLKAYRQTMEEVLRLTAAVSLEMRAKDPTIPREQLPIARLVETLRNSAGPEIEG